MTIKSIVKDWYIVSFYLKNEQNDCRNIGKVLWGTIDDPMEHQFWKKDDFVCSSLIATIDESKQLVYTNNSTYKLNGTGKCFISPAEDILLMRQGFSPIEILNGIAY